MSELLKNVSVLVVEDDPDICDLLQTILQGSGAEVTVTHSVDAAITAHRHRPAHVLVSDIRLGSSDGFALIAAVREHNKEYRGVTPAIALTAYSSPGDEERARHAGFNAYIRKPFDPSDITKTIAALLRGPVDTAA
jgi:CheY-like chemotaxis protein